VVSGYVVGVLDHGNGHHRGLAVDVTVTEAPVSNGDRKAAAAAILAAEPAITAAELGDRLGVKERQARNIRNAVRAVGERNGAVAAVPVVVADGKREVPPPARTKTATAKRKVTAERGPVDWAIIATVTAVAAIWSYSHIVDLAIAAGHGWRSYLLPLAIDGLLIAGVRAVGRDRRYPVAWIAITVGVVGTVAGNVLAVRPELADMADVAAVSAAFPAIALPTIVHLVRR
jgi:hypothetical protein